MGPGLPLRALSARHLKSVENLFPKLDHLFQRRGGHEGESLDGPDPCHNLFLAGPGPLSRRRDGDEGGCLGAITPVTIPPLHGLSSVGRGWGEWQSRGADLPLRLLSPLPRYKPLSVGTASLPGGEAGTRSEVLGARTPMLTSLSAGAARGRAAVEKSWPPLLSAPALVAAVEEGGNSESIPPHSRPLFAWFYASFPGGGTGDKGGRHLQFIFEWSKASAI